MKFFLSVLFIFFIYSIGITQNNKIPLLKDCDSNENKLACSYFTIHNLILTKLNQLQASSIKLDKKKELIISTILNFNKEGKLVKKNSVLYSSFINADAEFEELLKSIPTASPSLNNKGKPKIQYFRNTFYYKYVNNSFETWNNTKADEKDFFMPEKVPVYKGCKPNWSNKKLKDCMSFKITQNIQSAFNSDVAKKAGILPGSQVKIYVVFKIDETGKVIDIQARSSKKELEKEAIRVIKRLGKIEPGIKGYKTVVVPYAIPIVFKVTF